MLYMLEVEYKITSFYELAQMLLGDVPSHFEFLYSIVAVVMCLSFIFIIFGFLGLCFSALKRW
ncbi:MAG: hypothetical protein IJB82_02350 [Bacilli bacterium]|nr:hypothetical protein [Bacilli bacterium]